MRLGTGLGLFSIAVLAATCLTLTLYGINPIVDVVGLFEAGAIALIATATNRIEAESR